jgi:hypothetical protein
MKNYSPCIIKEILLKQSEVQNTQKHGFVNPLYLPNISSQECFPNINLLFSIKFSKEAVRCKKTADKQE